MAKIIEPDRKVNQATVKRGIGAGAESFFYNDAGALIRVSVIVAVGIALIVVAGILRLVL